ATVWLLVAAFVFSLLPLSFARSLQESSRRSQNSSTDTSIRVKINPQATKTQNGSAPNNQTSSAEKRRQSTDGGQENQSGADSQVSDENSPTSFDDPKLNQPKPKREPLPFDRPPLGAEDAKAPANKPAPSFDRSTPASPPTPRSSSV